MNIKENPYRFVQDYLGIELKPFQIVMFNEIDKAEISNIVCTRGKTFAPLYRNI